MKSFNRHNPVVATIGAWWLSNIILHAKAFHYGCAAYRDEQTGFPYTAAMEWHKAAELLSPNTRAAEYSWRQWERIMRLPRRLARPVGVSQSVVIPMKAGSAAGPEMVSASDRVLFAA